MSNRIWYTMPGPRRRLYLDIHDDPFKTLTMRAIRNAYWSMRKAGIHPMRARDLVYATLHAGRHTSMGKGYE